MKRTLITLLLMCLALSSYAQRDVQAGGCMEVASIENSDSVGNVGFDKQIALYKVKDNDGNPDFFLAISNTTASLTFGTEDSFTSFSFPSGGGVLLDLGTTYEEAMGNLDTLLDLFNKQDGTQKEWPCHDGSTIICTLHKGFLGMSISIAETSLSKSDIRSLKTSFKISKMLHPDL